jgi:hypothetical protein
MKPAQLARHAALRGAILFAALASVASTQNQIWIRQLGTSGNDSSTVASDGSGGVYVSGYTSGSLGGPSAGSVDVWIARYDGAGIQAWIRQFGTSSQDYAQVAAPDGSSGVYVGGTTRGSLGGPHLGSGDAWLARYDGAGNREWIRQLGTGTWDGLSAVASDGLGGVYVAGGTEGNLGGPSAGSGDVWLGRYDGSGNQVWIRQLGTNAGDSAHGAAPDELGGVYVIGLTHGDLGGSNAGHADAWLAHYDGAGNQNWVRQLGSSDYDAAHGAARDGSGGIYICGVTAGSLGGPHAGGSYDAWLARYDSAGNQTWVRQFGTNSDDRPGGAAPDGSGGVFLSGVTGGNLGGPNAGVDDIWLAHYSNQGNLAWIQQFGSNDYDGASVPASDGAGGVFVGGSTNGNLGGPNAGYYDAWLAHYGGTADPEFLAPSPCGQILSVLANEPLTFNITARATNGLPTQTASLALVTPANALSGANFTPPLGTIAQPASSQVTWTPTTADIGQRTVRIRAMDQLGVMSECEFQVFVEPDPPYVACEQRFVSASTASLDGQGEQVDYWNGRAIVGAPRRLVDGAIAIYEELGGGWTQVADIQHPFATGGQDSFGWAVAISGDWAVVGAPFEGTPGLFNGPGAAYVFRRDPGGNWTFVQELQRSGVISQDDRFGLAVDINGDELVVGAFGDNTSAPSAGAVYVYRLFANTWVLEQKLVASVVQPGIRFSVGLSIDSGRAVIGAPYEDIAAIGEVGAVYVFERQPNTTWLETARLTGPTATHSAFYGVSVDLSGNRAIVGAEGIGGVGQAYIYRRDSVTTWTLEGVLDPQVPAPSLTYGQQVALRGGIAVVNARNATVQGLPVAGEVELFELGTSSNWIYSRTLTKGAPSAFDSFGTGLALGAGVAMVGCPGDDTAGFANGGASYLFDLGIADCNANGNPDSCDLAAGSSQDCNGNLVPDECDLAGGGSSDCNANQVLDECELAANPSLDCNGDGIIDTCQFGTLDCNANQMLDPCETAQNPAIDINQNSIPDDCEDDAGTIYCTPNAPNSGFPGGGKMQAIGTPSVSTNDIVLIARDLPTNSFGFFITSRSPGFVPFPGGSQGILCLGGTIGRFQQQVQNAGTLNRISIPIDNQNIPSPTGPGFVTIVPGERWHFQAWFRDSVGGMSTSSFTEGLYIQY